MNTRRPGVYRFVNMANGMRYYGCGSNVAAREGDHLSRLARGHHENKRLQADYDIHGRAAFIFELLVGCDTFKEAKLFEAKLLRAIDKSWLYNIAP